MKTTREQIADFQLAFQRPLNNILQESLSIEDRVLLAKLLLEETVEYCTKGLGLKVYVNAYPPSAMTEEYGDQPDEIEVIDVGCPIDVIECADGLGDVNVVAHFCAHWHGINLDKITSEIHRSNMSKLGADGKPIINECKHYGGDKKPTLMTGVEAIPATMAQCHNRMQFNKCDDPNHLIDPTKPIGKILKGPNYTPPQLGPILAAGNWLSEPAKVHIDESTVTDRAKLDHCVDHPESTAENSPDGFGLAGGGFGAYSVCEICGAVFNKVVIEDGEE